MILRKYMKKREKQAEMGGGENLEIKKSEI